MKQQKPPVVIIKASKGTFPNYVVLGHRHLEKAHPPPMDQLGSTAGLVRFRVPTDLVRMGLTEALGEAVESVELIYRKAGF